MEEIKKTYLTPQGLKKLEEEYKELKEEKIPLIATKIDEAKQQGDLSENAEYHTAREEMAWAQTRVAELNNILQFVELISANSNNKNVRIGSKIILESDGKKRTITIVGAQEADPALGLISNESPMGEASLNKKVGDIVSFQAPKGRVEYKILEIE